MEVHNHAGNTNICLAFSWTRTVIVFYSSNRINHSRPAAALLCPDEGCPIYSRLHDYFLTPLRQRRSATTAAPRGLKDYRYSSMLSMGEKAETYHKCALDTTRLLPEICFARTINGFSDVVAQALRETQRDEDTQR